MKKNYFLFLTLIGTIFLQSCSKEQEAQLMHTQTEKTKAESIQVQKFSSTADTSSTFRYKAPDSLISDPPPKDGDQW